MDVKPYVKHETKEENLKDRVKYDSPAECLTSQIDFLKNRRLQAEVTLSEIKLQGIRLQMEKNVAVRNKARAELTVLKEKCHKNIDSYNLVIRTMKNIIRKTKH